MHDVMYASSVGQQLLHVLKSLERTFTEAAHKLKALRSGMKEAGFNLFLAYEVHACDHNCK